MTQDALADAAGLDRAQVQRIERGTANPTLATMYSIAEAVGQSIKLLIPD